MILICDIAKIIPPLTTNTKKIFKDPIPAYAGMTKVKVRKVKNVIPTLGVTKGADNSTTNTTHLSTVVFLWFFPIYMINLRNIEKCGIIL